MNFFDFITATHVFLNVKNNKCFVLFTTKILNQIYYLEEHTWYDIGVGRVKSKCNKILQIYYFKEHTYDIGVGRVKKAKKKQLQLISIEIFLIGSNWCNKPQYLNGI